MPQNTNFSVLSSKAISHTGARTKAADLRSMVREEITAENCHVTPTAQFLKKLFPVPEESIERIFKELVDKARYDEETKRWPDMPASGTLLEQKYYGPFTDIANAITQACRDTHPEHEFELVCRWLDRHSKTQASNDKIAALIRPDILALLATLEDADALENLIEGAAEDQVSPSEPSCAAHLYRV